MAREDLASIVVEDMDGDTEAGSAGGAGLAAVGEVLGESGQFLAGAERLLNPYKSAHGGGRWKTGVSRSDSAPAQAGRR